MTNGSATKSIDVLNESNDIGCSNCWLKKSSAAESDPGLEDDENRTRPSPRVSPWNSSSETSKLTLDSDPLVESCGSTTTIFSTLFLSLLLLFFFTGGGGYVHPLPPRPQRPQIGLTSSHYPGQRSSIICKQDILSLVELDKLNNLKLAITYKLAQSGARGRSSYQHDSGSA